MLKEIGFRLTGIAPLIVHNGQLADPLNKWAKLMKAITSKRNKTEADLEEMSKVEFFGGLYLNDSGPCMPDFCLDALMISGAKIFKDGNKAKSGCWAVRHADIEYDGPRDPEEMFADGRFVIRVGAKPPSSSGRVQRTRPIFRDWAMSVAYEYDDTICNEKDIVAWMTNAGAQKGLCDWRPKYGRFTTEKLS